MLTNPMNILFLLKDTPKGGVEKVSFDLALSLKNTGHNIIFSFINTEGDWLTKFKQEFEIIDLEGPATLKSFMGLLSATKALSKLYKTIGSKDIDVIISAKEQANLFTAIISIISPVRTIIVRHVSILDKQTTDASWLTPLLYKYAYFNIDHIVAVSKEISVEIKETVLNKNQSKVQYCPNPVISPELDQLASQKITPPLPSGVNICTVGRLSYQKGIDILIEAFYKAHLNQRKNIYLHLIGDGDLENEIRAQVKRLSLEDSVFFHGFQSNPYPYMKQCNIFVLSSRYEGLPTVLIEAMYLNSNIISSDCRTGPKEILEIAGFGTLYPNNNSKSLASSLLDTLEGNIESKSQSKESLSEEYSIENCTKCYIRLLFESADRS